MTKQYNSFRLPSIAAVMLMVAIVGPSSLLAQSETVAKIRLASFQQEEFDEPGVTGGPVNQTPSTELEKRLNSIHVKWGLVKQQMEKENADAEKLRQAELDKMNAALEPQPPIEIPSEVPDPRLATEVPPIDDAAPPVSGTPVVAKPINPFKLASSLFRTGNITASRRSYEAGLEDADPEEKVWLQCLIACCYRLEGDYESADSTFRDVTNQRSGTFAVDYAKWSLDYVDQRRNAAKHFREIELEIDGIMSGLKKTNSKK